MPPGLNTRSIIEDNGLDKIIAEPPVEDAIVLGKRNLDWLNFINQTRAEDQKLRLTNPSTRGGSPIDKPKKSGPTLIEARSLELKATMPSFMQKILFENVAFTASLPISDEDFVIWSRKVDSLYQSAARWKSQIPYREGYTEYRAADVRGLYYLNLEPDLDLKLDGFLALSDVEQKRLGAYLIDICFNSKGIKFDCPAEFQEAINQNKIRSFYALYITDSKALWNSFFEIPELRTDIVWTSAQPDIATVPFRTTPTQQLHDFMLNVEDEWKWDQWRLKLDFQPDAEAHLEFKPGVVPNVDKIAGNIITMDENAPLEEYEVKWTIRHEFGHVLGFPDCYVEFYEPSENVMISYQLDITNLMCSRAGNLKEIHFLEMKRAYFK